MPSKAPGWLGTRGLSASLLVVATLLAGLGLAFLSAAASPKGVPTYTGRYEADVTDARTGEERLTTVPIPGLFTDEDLPRDVRVRVRVPVQVVESDAGSVAVYVDRMRHAAVARWDGARIGQLGQLSGTRLVQPRDGSFLAAVPAQLANPGPHLLELEIAGAWDDGGLLGELRVGSTAALARLQQWREFERMGLVIVAIFASLVHLSVAVRRPGRWDHLLLGLVIACFGAYLFGLSDAWFLAFEDGAMDLRLRMRRGALMMGVALCVALGARIGLGRVDRISKLILGVNLGVVAMDVLPPDLYWNTLGNRFGDYWTVTSAIWVALCAAAGIRAGRPGAGALASTVLVAFTGAFFDILLSRGLITFSPLTMPSQMAVWGTLAASIGLRDTDAQERYETLVAQASDGILRLSLTGNVLEANAAAATVLGETRDAPSLLAFVAPSDVPAVREHLALARRAPASMEFGLGDGRAVEASTSRMEDGGLLSIIRDVTERRRMQEGMVRAARLESVGQLAGGIAHDFNNVLGGVLGQVSLLRLQYGAQDDLDGRLQRLERNLMRATALCRRLLTLARGGSPVRQRIAVADLVEQSLELIRPAVEPSVRLEVALAPGLPTVHVVVSEIEEVLMNLVVNARDASPPGAEVRLEALHAVQGVEFRVRDHGGGVPLEARERIFEPFYTTKGIGKGTGLGLAVVARVVRDHGGHVRVEEAPGGGARFVVWLPETVATAESSATAGAETLQRRVFVVDDEPLVRDAAAEVLRHLGHEVLAFSSGTEALQAVGRAPPSLLLTDVVMPGMDGIQLATAMTGNVPGLEVVLMSGFMPQVDTCAPVRDGRWKVLEKPFRREDIQRAVSSPSPRGAA